MTALSKTKSHHKPVVDFESSLESVKSYKWFCPKKYESVNHTNNQQKCIIVSNQDQIKMSVSVKNVVAITFMYLIISFSFVIYKNDSIVTN